MNSRTRPSTRGSRGLISGQSEARLGAVERAWARHQGAPPAPVSERARASFEELAAQLDPQRTWILDAGCGTGDSCLALAHAHRETQILGIDRSQARLARGAQRRQLSPQAARVRLASMDLVAFWTLAREAGWRFAKTYLLYPNPAPKASQAAKRWGSHPILPSILRTSEAVELRTNWRPYAEEFAHALRLSQEGIAVQVEALDEEPILSPFGKKYRERGERCWVVRS